MTAGPLDLEMGALAAEAPVLQAVAYVYASAYAAAIVDTDAGMARTTAGSAALDFLGMLREAGLAPKRREVGRP